MNGAKPAGETQILSEADLQRLCQLLYARTGMIFGEAKRYYIERRVAIRMAKSGVHNTAAYLNLAATNPAEMEALVNAFTINETYFYREESQLECLGHDILPAVTGNRRPGERVRIWSLPCSTGEEPYSIAIWLLENWPMVDTWNIEILGSDIDTVAIERARRGEYGERALHRLPKDVLERYFNAERDLNREIIDDLKESVHWSSVNLVDPLSVAAQGRFDIIFCRNLLIYFDDDARQRAARHLYDALNPGGFLCLGHTESMSRISDRFELVRFDDAIVHRRP